MKKNVLFLIGCFFVCSILSAYASPATDAKAALIVIRLAYSCSNSNGA